MTRRLLHALAALYGLAAVVLLRMSMVAHSHGDQPRAVFCAGTAALLATAIAHHAYHRDELRDTRRQLEVATRRRALRDGIVLGWADLERVCCLRAWESRGDAHDPHHCTREDQAA